MLSTIEVNLKWMYLILIIILFQSIDQVFGISCSTYDSKTNVHHTFTCYDLEFCCESKCCKYLNYWHYWVCSLFIIIACCAGGCWYSWHYKRMKTLYNQTAASQPTQPPNWLHRRPFLTTWGVLLPSVRSHVRQQQQLRRQLSVTAAGGEARNTSLSNRPPSLRGPSAQASDVTNVEDPSVVVPLVVTDDLPPSYNESVHSPTLLPPSYSTTVVNIK